MLDGWDGHPAVSGSGGGDAGYALARGTFVDKAGTRVWYELRKLGSELRFARNEMLLVFGAPSDHVLLIEEGLVKVLLPGKGRDLVAGFCGSGELLGEQGVLFSEVRSATVVAHTRGSATRIPGSLFLSYVERNPAVGARCTGFFGNVCVGRIIVRSAWYSRMCRLGWRGSCWRGRTRWAPRPPTAW